MSFQTEALEILGHIGSNLENLGFLSQRLDRLIPFVGAGLSAEFKYPTWEALLQQIADEHAIRDIIKPLIQVRAYEEAAEKIEQLAPGSLDTYIRAKFDPEKLSKPLVSGAVRYVPGFSNAFVITTNFDGVLEAAFRDAGKPFEEVFPGKRIVQASAAIHDNRRALLKLHGSYDDTPSRVLTLTEYASEYGPDPDAIDLIRPLPSVLQQALGARPILFLGCSLQSDRTTKVIASVVERLPGLTHFALLPESENTLERTAQLRRWKIYPLFFRGHEFDRIERFLALVARAAAQPIRPRTGARTPTRIGMLAASILSVALMAGGAWYYRRLNPAVESFSYRGKVIDDRGNPVIGASVRIEDELGTLDKTNLKQAFGPIVVREDGYFQFSLRAFPESSFKIVFEKPGYCREVHWTSLPPTGQVMAFPLRHPPCE